VFAERLQRYSPELLKKGWHVHYRRFRTERGYFVIEPSKLTRYDEDGNWNLTRTFDSSFGAWNPPTANERMLQLQNDLSERDGRIARLDAAVSERDSQISHFQQEIAERDSQISHFQQEIAERDSQISHFQQEIAERDSQISHLQRRVQFLEKDMETISQSLIFRALRFATSHIDRTFPDGTRRGALRRMVIAKLHAIADKGRSSSVKKDKQIARSELREIEPPPTAVRERQYVRWLEANDIDQVSSAQSEPRLGYDVILFPIIDWDFRYQRPQQICTQFAEDGHRVFYLKTDFEVRPGDPSRSPWVSQITKNVYEVALVSALSLVNTRKAATEGITDRELAALAESMDELIHEYGIVSALCLAEFPVWTPLLEKLKAKYGWRIVHDCLDRYRGFSNIGNVAISLEEKLSRMSDLVFASSLPIHEEQKLLNAKTVLVRNAADFEHFNNKPKEEDPEIRRLFERIRASGTRVVGYYGAIADWFDVGLMKHVATSRPEWQFVLIGSTALSDVSPLVGMSNVHLLGEQPYSKLPQFLHGFDVCVIPFLTGSLTEAVNPTKVYEYLSAGKPVVAVALPELSELAGLVYTANDPADFVQKLEQAMGEDSESLRKKRIEFARQNTWEARFATIDETIRNLYPRVTIVVVTRNNLNLVTTCLRSIFAYTEYPNYEVVLVDNASNDGTVEYLTELRKEYSELKLLLQTENVSFARAVNTAIESSSGEYIAILNDDVVVTRGWLTRLVQHLCDDCSIGLIGASTDFAGNEAMLERKFSRIAELQQFAFEFYWENLGTLLPLRTLAMFCIVIPKRVVEKVGSLDETFSTGMFEDDDYSYRVRLSGLRTLCAGDVFIHHVGKVSFRKLSDDEYRKIFQDNRARFEEKWKMSWIPHAGGLNRRNDIILRSYELERVLRKDESLTRTAVLLPVFTTERRSEFAQAFVRQGFRVILVRNAEEPQSKDGFETVAPNVYAYSGPLEVLERIDRPFVVGAESQAQNLVFFRNPIVLYDCSRDDELASDAVGRRSDMLERAEVVLVDDELQLSRISKERPDAVLCARGSDLERILQNHLLASVQTHSD
jgi:GT2 family glycosyltransferase/glycosyltransferase involved in cell wall biosynthesis